MAVEWPSEERNRPQVLAGRPRRSPAAIIDSQSVKATLHKGVAEGMTRERSAKDASATSRWSAKACCWPSSSFSQHSGSDGCQGLAASTRGTVMHHSYGVFADSGYSGALVAWTRVRAVDSARGTTPPCRMSSHQKRAPIRALAQETSRVMRVVGRPTAVSRGSCNPGVTPARQPC